MLLNFICLLIIGVLYQGNQTFQVFLWKYTGYFFLCLCGCFLHCIIFRLSTNIIWTQEIIKIIVMGWLLGKNCTQWMIQYSSKVFLYFHHCLRQKVCIFIPWNRWITHCITNIRAKFICCWGLRLSVCAIWSRQSVISLPISSQVCAAVPLASLPTPQAIVQYIQPQNILNKK